MCHKQEVSATIMRMCYTHKLGLAACDHVSTARHAPGDKQVQFYCDSPHGACTALQVSVEAKASS